MFVTFFASLFRSAFTISLTHSRARGADDAFTILLTHSRARGADDGGRRRRDASYGVARDSHPVSTIR